METPPILLEAIGLTKSYGDAPGHAVRVLEGVSLSVAPGETVAVIGPSGSGKSTLLHLLGGLDVPDAGRVLLDGDDLAALPEAARASVRNRKIGFVFQLHHLLPQCTVLENVLLPALLDRPPWAPERARTLLARVGLSHRLDHRPAELSVGERQRAAVARALVIRPRLLLADEPTGALDRRHADDLSALLLELNREEGTALVVATHAPPLARRMGRVLALEDGRLRPGAP